MGFGTAHFLCLHPSGTHSYYYSYCLFLPTTMGHNLYPYFAYCRANGTSFCYFEAIIKTVGKYLYFPAWLMQSCHGHYQPVKRNTMQKKIVIFCGEATAQEHIKKSFSAHTDLFIFHPPAGQGDIWRNIREDVGSIVLIDCKTNGDSCVWHKEIVDALRVHIRVIGAGGMGAIRAKELQQVGMEGVGRFFERIADEEDAYAALSEQTPETTLHDTLTAIRYAIATGRLVERTACGTVITSLTDHKWRRCALNLRPCVVNSNIVYGAEIIHHFLQFTSPEALAEISAKMYATFYTLEWAKQTSTTCPHTIRTAIFEREKARIHSTEWLLSNGLVQCEYASLLEQEALLHHLSSSPWQTYIEAWANKAGIIVPEMEPAISIYDWIITKNPAYFGYIWEYEVGLWDWLQRNKRVSDIARDVIATRS
jgi:hypothetical protein